MKYHAGYYFEIGQADSGAWFAHVSGGPQALREWATPELAAAYLQGCADFHPNCEIPQSAFRIFEKWATES